MIHTASAQRETGTKNNTSKTASLRRLGDRRPRPRSADSELFFLIVFSATTYPSPSPASPRSRAWALRLATPRTVPHGQQRPPAARTNGCYVGKRNPSPEHSWHRWKCFATILLGNKRMYSGDVCSYIQTTNLRSQTLRSLNLFSFKIQFWIASAVATA